MAAIAANYPSATIPVLQDTPDDRALWNSGASMHYLYIIDGDRNVHYVHYSETVPFSDAGARMVEEIDAVLGR